jgi:hypothetical protein
MVVADLAKRLDGFMIEDLRLPIAHLPGSQSRQEIGWI